MGINNTSTNIEELADSSSVSCLTVDLFQEIFKKIDPEVTIDFLEVSIKKVVYFSEFIKRMVECLKKS